MGVNSIMNDAGRIGFVIKGDYDSTATYDFLDLVYFNGATYVAKKLTVGNTPDNTEFWHIFAGGNIDVNDVAPTFLQAETRENISSGEKLPVLFGKIKKFFADLKTVAFTGSYTDLSNKPSASDIGAVATSKVLDTAELISANTASGNVAGALAVKEIISLINHFTQNDGKTPRYNGNSLDDINVNSVYESNVGTSGNAPSNGWAYILTFIHYSSVVHRVQVYINLGAAKVYTRRCFDNVWSAWLEFADINSTVARATADANGNNIKDTYMPFGGYYVDTVSINDMTSVGIHRKYLSPNDNDSVYLGGNIGGQIAIIVTREAGYIRQYIIGFSDSVAGKVWWRQNKTQGTLSLSYEDKLCTYNGAVNGIEFSIENGELKYSYDKSIWGE